MTLSASLACARGQILVDVAIHRAGRHHDPWRRGWSLEDGFAVSPMALELVERSRSGDADAFAALSRQIGDRLFAVAYTILGDRGAAEDVSQQSLIHIWRHLPSLREPERFEAWSYRIAVNAARAEGRRLQRWAIASRQVIGIDATRDHASGIAVRDEVERALRRLSVDHRTVLVLKHVADLPNGEIAEIVGVPEGTVRSRLHHAQALLRAAIAADARPGVAGGLR